MSTPQPTNDDDLGVEYFDDVLSQQNQEVPEKKGFLQKAGETGVFGVLGTAEGRRHTGRTAARVGETLAGLPGDIKELFNSIMIGVPEYFAGEELPRWRSAVEGDPSMLTGIGPTSEQLREGITQPLTGEYLEPQNKWEAFGDEIASDAAVMMIPVKGKVPFARAIGKSIFANTGGEIVGAFAGDKAKAYTKMGLLFSTDLISSGNKGGVKQYIRTLYKDMEAAIPEGAEISAKNLSTKLDKIEAVLKKGDPLAPSKQPAFQKINAVRDKIKSGMIDIDEVIQLTKDTNESIFGLGELKRGQNELYNVRKTLHETMGEYGKTNAEVLSKWQSANEAYAATETSRRVGNWIKKNIRAKEYIHAASALGIEGAFLGGPATLGTIGAAGGIAATAYGAEIMKRIATSPSLRIYYQNVVKNALNQNKGAFLRNMKMLDDGLKKSLDENPYETIEFED